MSETIFNLFAYSDGRVITHIGIRDYPLAEEGSDDRNIAFLQQRCRFDHVDAYKARIVSPEITVGAFQAKHRLGTAIQMFSELLAMAGAPPSPLFVMTTIVDGEPWIDYSYVGHFDPIKVDGMGEADDYLVHYTTPHGIDFIRMFDDDYFRAIKLLFNNKHLVSSVKLLMIFIDTMAFVEFGDRRDIFKEWLDRFVDLGDIELSSDELWELRNGVLHMSNLNSRAVRSGKVLRLVPCVGLGSTELDLKRREKRFDLLRLINAVGAGVGKWMVSYNENPEKLETFVERYDTVISDARLTHRFSG